MWKGSHHVYVVLAGCNCFVVGAETFARSAAPKCVRILWRDAIVSVMPLISNSKGVRRVECDLSERAPVVGGRLY
jgi:hypothetical protein